MKRLLSAALKGGSIKEFQKAVYAAVLSIQKGQARPYKWVAEKVGRPKAYRAVGNALNKNPWPVKVPCHRIIRSDGTIGGYYKGSPAKAKMLRTEGIDS